MIEEIISDSILKKYIGSECKENNISVTIDKNIIPKDITFIKVDEYYNKEVYPIPPAIDSLIPVRESKNSYSLYLIELKNIKSLDGFERKQVYDKFKTTINDFMSIRYNYIFLNDKYSIKKIRLYFVSDPLKLKGKEDKEIKKKIEGTKLEFHLNLPLFKFKNKICKIEYRVPEPIISKKVVE
jgi:hypothetical protein